MAIRVVIGGLVLVICGVALGSAPLVWAGLVFTVIGLVGLWIETSVKA